MSGFLKLWKIITNINKEVLDVILPVGFSLLYIIINLISSIVESVSTKTIVPFIHALSTSIFALDFSIYEQVQIALVTPAKFGIVNLLIIFSSLGILYFFIKAIEKLIAFLMTNQSIAGGLGTFLFAVLILGLVEFVAVLATHQKMIMPGSGIFSLIFNSPIIFSILNTNLINLKTFLYNNI